jgi:23S rRNA pseudouridine1911/1915/1917 synthase
LKKYILKKDMILIDALKLMYPDSSTTTLRDMLKRKRIVVDNNTVVKANQNVAAGQKIQVVEAIKSISHGITILYEDKYLLVINKPEKLLSVPLDNKCCDNVLGVLRQYFVTNQIFAVHRIDRDTSGIMVFAKGRQSKAALDKIIKNHDFTRVYVAVVMGQMDLDKGVWKSYLTDKNEYEVTSNKNKYSSASKIAITHYAVMKRTKNFSFLKITLETGRKHQIRVHCSEANHPIVGDKKYGDDAFDPIARLCLHAHVLEFYHPFNNKKISVTSKLPLSFSKLI